MTQVGTPGPSLEVLLEQQKALKAQIKEARLASLRKSPEEKKAARKKKLAEKRAKAGEALQAQIKEALDRIPYMVRDVVQSKEYAPGVRFTIKSIEGAKDAPFYKILGARMDKEGHEVKNRKYERLLLSDIEATV